MSNTKKTQQRFYSAGNLSQTHSINDMIEYLKDYAGITNRMQALQIIYKKYPQLKGHALDDPLPGNNRAYNLPGYEIQLDPVDVNATTPEARQRAVAAYERMKHRSAHPGEALWDDFTSSISNSLNNFNNNMRVMDYSIYDRVNPNDPTLKAMREGQSLAGELVIAVPAATAGMGAGLTYAAAYPGAAAAGLVGSYFGGEAVDQAIETYTPYLDWVDMVKLTTNLQVLPYMSNPGSYAGGYLASAAANNIGTALTNTGAKMIMTPQGPKYIYPGEDVVVAMPQTGGQQGPGGTGYGYKARFGVHLGGNHTVASGGRGLGQGKHTTTGYTPYAETRLLPKGLAPFTIHSAPISDVNPGYAYYIPDYPNLNFTGPMPVITLPPIPEYRHVVVLETGDPFSEWFATQRRNGLDGTVQYYEGDVIHPEGAYLIKLGGNAQPNTFYQRLVGVGARDPRGPEGSLVPDSTTVRAVGTPGHRVVVGPVDPNATVDPGVNILDDLVD